MTFRNRMHPQVANAEILVFKELSKRGLTNAMTTQKVIVLKSCKPDFIWHDKRKILFLDGEQVHPIDDENDKEIVKLLELQGWDVKRIRYHAPLGMKRLEQIMVEIEVFLLF